MGSPVAIRVECWTEVGFCLLIVALRMYARIKIVGIRGLWYDDLFAVIAVSFAVADAAVIDQITRFGTGIGLTSEERDNLTDEELARRVYGAKVLFAGWNTYTSLVWALKGVALAYFFRITLGLFQQKIVRYLSWIVLFTYIAMMIVVNFQCIPLSHNWQIRPYPGDRCTLSKLKYQVMVVLNVGTDVAILCIPIPLLWKVKLPLARKMMVALFLCSGIFVIIAALLRCILSLQNINDLGAAISWASREALVGTLGINAAAIRPLFMRGSDDTTGISSGKTPNKYLGKHGYEMQSSHKSELGKGDISTTIKRHGSDESILMPAKSDLAAGIQTTVTYEVHSTQLNSPTQEQHWGGAASYTNVVAGHQLHPSEFP